jgi:DNA-binding response OmpR family regulator
MHERLFKEAAKVRKIDIFQKSDIWPMKVLIVEDEKLLSEGIAGYLKQEDYVCDLAENYPAALEKIELYSYDCILLDVNLPGGNGLQLLKELRENEKMDGVLVISARNALEDKIEGLKLGADDYLSKPFHLSELGARVAAIIRRKHFAGSNFLRFFEITIDIQGRQALIHGKPIELTRKEYQLLLYFVTNKGRVISRNAIAEHLWGDEMDIAGNYDFIYTHIKNLRKKMTAQGCADYIQSVYGVGYKFTER